MTFAGSNVSTLLNHGVSAWRRIARADALPAGSADHRRLDLLLQRRCAPAARFGVSFRRRARAAAARGSSPRRSCRSAPISTTPSISFSRAAAISATAPPSPWPATTIRRVHVVALRQPFDDADQSRPRNPPASPIRCGRRSGRRRACRSAPRGSPARRARRRAGEDRDAGDRAVAIGRRRTADEHDGRLPEPAARPAAS